MQNADRRIALLVGAMGSGGAERVALNLAEEFARRGFAVDLVLVAAEGPLLAEVPPTIRIVDLGCTRARHAVGRLRRYLKSERPAALIAFTFHVNQLAALAAFGVRRTRLILTVHSSLRSGLRQAPLLTRASLMIGALFLYRSASRVVAVSDGAAADLRALARLPRHLVVRIYNPVIAASFDEKAAEALDARWTNDDRRPLVLAAGRLTKAKDYPTLISAFARVAEQTDARLLILGEGEERAELEALISSLGLRERVSMPGRVDNPLPYMRAADVFVLSSSREGFGNSLVEAMATGTPVIATDCPHGPREILQDGRWGILVPVGDSAALATAMLNVLRSGGASGRERALEFTVEAAADEYLRLLF